MTDDRDLIELCRCGADTSDVPSSPASHSYGVTELGDVLFHTSIVTCPACGLSALRRHQVPFLVRVA